MSTSDQYLTIKEWGVKLKMADADKVTVKVDDTPGTEAGGPYDSIADITILPQYLTNKTPDCESLGVGILRAKQGPTDFTNNKVGNYYYWVTGGQGHVRMTLPVRMINCVQKSCTKSIPRTSR